MSNDWDSFSEMLGVGRRLMDCVLVDTSDRIIALAIGPTAPYERMYSCIQPGSYGLKSSSQMPSKFQAQSVCTV